MKSKGYLKKAVIGAFLAAPLLIGGIASFVNTASFTGLAGMASAAAVGVGTAVGAVGLAVPGILAGLVLGGSLAMLTSNRRHNGSQAFAPFMTKLVGVAAIVGSAAGTYGGYKGYQLTKDKLESKEVKTSFNNAAYSAPAAQKTLILTPKMIAACRMG